MGCRQSRHERDCGCRWAEPAQACRALHDSLPHYGRQEKSPGLNFQGFFSVAEMEGFEPPHALRRLADFESAPFGHLGTSPDRSIIPAVMRKIKPKISRNAIFVDKCHGRRYNTECKRFFETTLMENQHPKPPACRPWRMYNQEETACQFRYPMISRRRRP